MGASMVSRSLSCGRPPPRHNQYQHSRFQPLAQMNRGTGTINGTRHGRTDSLPRVPAQTDELADAIRLPIFLSSLYRLWHQATVRPGIFSQLWAIRL